MDDFEETDVITGKPVDPFYLPEDDYHWLGLDKIPTKVYNPFDDEELLKKYPDPAEEMIRLMMNPNYFYFTCKHLLNIELLPFQCTILEVLWRKRLPMLIGTRGMSKSFLLAVYALLRMIFNPGCRVVICAASFRQSRQVFEYMTKIWENASILRDIAGKSKTVGPRREIDRCQFQIGNSHTYSIPLGQGDKIRGLRANFILADEFSSIPEEIFNLVVQGFGVVSEDPIEKVKQYALIDKLKKMGKWNEHIAAMMRQGLGGNQIVYSGTAFYEFNHFCRYFKKWHKIISSKGKAKDLFGDSEGIPEGFEWTDYAILRVPYTHVPKGLLDPGIVAQAKATLHHNQFLMEYGAVFPADSDGFYKRSIIESATTNKPISSPSGEQIQFSASRMGDKDKAYVIGVDPAADQDNAAITVLEMAKDHRKIIYCWTTNRKKYNALKREMAKINIYMENDYYRYIAKKIRSLMRIFNTERIIMDKNGGGVAISEALASPDTCEGNELRLFEIIDPEKPKMTDGENGLHILQLLMPTQDINVESNHGMLKDLQDKVLLFPKFDTIEVEKAIIADKLSGDKFDTYEELFDEIEELKNEMTSIVVTASSNLGKETFDTPKLKTGTTAKGYLRKDRYSALLYANYYARNRGKETAFKIEYKAVGGTLQTLKNISVNNGSMYHGPGTLKFTSDSAKYNRGKH